MSSIPDLTPDQARAVDHIRARQMMRIEDIMHISNFKTDAIGGFVPIMKRGEIGLEPEHVGSGLDTEGAFRLCNAADEDVSFDVVTAG